MQRVKWGLLTSAALTLGLVLGCGGNKDGGTTTGGGGTGGETTGGKAGGSSKGVKFVEGKGTGTLKGHVKLDGTVDVKTLTKEYQARFNEKADQKDYCLKGGPESVEEQRYRVGRNNQVGNVFVWIEPAEPRTSFKVPKEQLDRYKGQTITLRQPHCTFVPHCLVLFPQYRDEKGALKPTGQKLHVVNDAKISHNTRWSSPENTNEGRTLAAGEDLGTYALKPDRNNAVFIQCNIHPWMEAYARAFDHPYAALTKGQDMKTGQFLKADDPAYGTYEIPNVPAGVKVRVIAWHERAGYLDGGKNGVEKELAKGDNEQNFTLTPKQ